MNRMIITRLITRHSTVNNQRIHSGIRLLNKDESSDSSDSSDSDNEKAKTKPAKKLVAERNEESKKQTADLLNSLLIKMSTGRPKTATVDRAIPKRKPLPKPVPKPTLEEKLIGAAKDVAVSLGGDVKQNEVDLLNKIFSAGTPKSESTQTPTPEPTNASDSSLSELLAGMNIDRVPSKDSSTAEEMLLSQTVRVREMARKFQKININHAEMSRARSQLKPANLYGGPRLNIFEPPTKTSDDSPNIGLETWEALEQQDIKSLLIHPPENIFQEMIRWTEKGILWKFPIDNEIGMEEEQNVHFSEHVFMERHLQGWCPKKGPIRHFMELVCVGLSKNPYMTVQEKKDHIMWYQDFFSGKQELLKEVGAIDSDIPPSNSAKQIES